MRYHLMMRTTIDIDSDVLSAARELAKAQGLTIGATISQLARTGLTNPALNVAQPAGAVQSVQQNMAAYIFEPFAANGTIVTSTMVNQLRDDD